MANRLWTPDRDIPLDVKGKVAISAEAMRRIRDMHEVAQRHGIQLVCKDCQTPFQGSNDGWSRTQSVYCKCRELVAEVGGQVIRPQ